MIFIIHLFISTWCFIKYDKGLNTNFNSQLQSSFKCYNSYQQTQTISFSGTFQNIPKVFLQQNLADWESGNGEFQLSITSVSLTNFMVQIVCPTTVRVHKLQLQWYAIDDERVQVINAFNIANPTQSTIYQHPNANVEKAIIFLTSLGYYGALEFVLSISSITKTTVTVSISNPSSKFANIRSIGYQIVLGTNEVFDILGIQTVTTSSYNSGNLNLQNNKWLQTPIIGLNYPNNYYLQFRWTQTTTATTISYTVNSWDTLVKHTHQKVWMSYIINTIYLPLEIQTVRISQKYDLEALNRPTIYTQLPQSDEIFNQIGTFNVIVDKQYSPVLINVIFKCSQGKKIKSQFNKCNSCPMQKIKIFNHYCHNNINQISYFPKYISTIQAHEELKITISSTKITINQITYNEVITETSILDIELLNT
ncbi:unnamed protein product [Paramecium sonneborni]|uniref:H-type lectin domain-containing protein n=1 Tax=Paramecium sonneborni TaxID=65129 RepID=A0A8S1REA4_9CILI|nr:unnamed protein product [Paramecium sonneborni]